MSLIIGLLSFKHITIHVSLSWEFSSNQLLFKLCGFMFTGPYWQCCSHLCIEMTQLLRAVNPLIQALGRIKPVRGRRAAWVLAPALPQHAGGVGQSLSLKSVVFLPDKVRAF